MATILTFPGVAVCNPFAGLEPGRKALVVARENRGDFSVRLAPAVTEQDKRPEMRLGSAAEALAYAEQSRRMCPALYQMVVDLTGGAA